MSNTYQLVIDATYKGQGAFQKAQSDLAGLDKQATTTPAKMAAGFKGIAIPAAAAAGAIGAAAVAAKQLYNEIRQGAQLQTTAQRFDKLAESIGTTSNAMLGDLRTATKGMISDMELMASASQIISLRLADNEGQVTRLATVVGTLGWDMQQVILTFANMSHLRLDALGLSVEEVKTKAAELEAAGMSAQEAFKEAVILAGEARLDVGGVSESEQAFKRLDAAITNTRNSASLMILALAESAGAIEDIEATATRLSVLPQYFAAINLAVEAGVMSSGEAIIAKLNASGTSTDELIKKIQEMEGAVRQSSGGWFYMGDAARMVNADIRNELEMTRIGILHTGAELRNLLGMAGQTDWMGGMGGEDWLSPANPDPFRGNRQRWWVLQSQARARNADALGPFANIGQETEGIRAYTGAVNAATEAETALAAARQGMVSAFAAELAAKPEDGLIDAAGVVNMEAANKALYEQAQAAGATASQLALLGVATGQFTEEQAQAALKAAILQEKIKQIAAGVASGELSYGDAAGGLASFSEQLNSGALASAAGGIEGVAAAADAFANGTYEAELSVENRAAMTAIQEAILALGQLTGTHYINLVTTTTGAPPTTNNSNGGGGPSTPDENRNRANVINGKSGGASYNVSVVNYVNGSQQSRSTLDDVTTDKIKAALGALGVRS